MMESSPLQILPVGLLCRSQLISQFPYEACIIRKDLLPQTARRCTSPSTAGTTLESPTEQSSKLAAQRKGQEGGPSVRGPVPGDPATWHPCWFPACYDLATEAHHFLLDYQQVREHPPSHAHS